MGKKSKSKGKSRGAEPVGNVLQQKQNTSATPVASLDEASIQSVLSHLDEEELRRQFESATTSSPEEGVQMARELYQYVLRKKLASQRKIKLIEDKIVTLQDNIRKCKISVEEESNTYATACSQKEKLEALYDGLTKKKDVLLEEARVQSSEQKDIQKSRTSELISETQEISAKLDNFNVMRENLSQENIQLKEKLKILLDAYSKEEDDFNMNIAKLNTNFETAKERLESQSNIFEEGSSNMNELEAKFLEAVELEKVLKSKMIAKSSRFEEFQVSITKNNDAFKVLKQQMDEKSKDISFLEKENGKLSAKKVKMEAAMTDMTNDIVKTRQTVEVTHKQMEKLTNLCSVLQAEIDQLTEESPKV